jgi:hypothetical protein
VEDDSARIADKVRGVGRLILLPLAWALAVGMGR